LETRFCCGGSAFCTAERCREISQGYACFTRTPGSGERLKPAPSEGCEESSHAFSVRHWVNVFTRGCAPLNPWLIFCHPFGVSFETETKRLVSLDGAESSHPPQSGI